MDHTDSILQSADKIARLSDELKILVAEYEYRVSYTDLPSDIELAPTTSESESFESEERVNF